MRFVPFLVGMILHLFLSAQPPGDWELKSEKDGTKVYYRRSSEIYEVKLTAAFKTPLTGFRELLFDVSRYSTWGYKCTDVRLIKQVSATEFYYYVRIDFPWPMADRDLVMHTTMQQDPNNHRIVIFSEATPDMVPPVEGIVRIRDAHTKWVLIPGQDNWVYGAYEIYSNPGGNIPDWLVNMAIDVGPKETFQNIRGLLREPRYQNAK
jgi:hypothetical protein